MTGPLRTRGIAAAIVLACATPSAAAAPPVTVGSYMYSPGQWQVTLDVPPDAKEIFVALSDGAFISTGYWTAVTGESIPKSLFTITDASQTIRVRLLTKDGKTLGPFTFAFDRDKEVVNVFKSGLEDGKSEWVSFREWPAGRWLIYFGYLTSKRCGIREVRYSIDSDALDQVMRFPACNSREPYAAAPSDFDDILELKRKPGTVKVEILYADGTKSEVVTLRPSPIDAVR